MTGMNWRRIFLGGVLASVVISAIWLPVLAALNHDFAAMASALGLAVQISDRMLLYGLVAMPVAGILSVWLYAAIRPRYGAGPRTAARAGIAVWIATLIVDGAWESLGVMSGRLFVIMKVTDLVAFVVGTIVGAWVYHEGSATGGAG